MKIQLLSDLHIEFEAFDYVDTDADVLVLAGDIHLNERGILWAMEHVTDKPVLYVLGNHEYYGKAYPKLPESIKEELLVSNIHLLEKDVVTIDGVNFLGCTLWTDFNLFGNPRVAGSECQQLMTDYKKIRRSPSYSKIRSLDIARIHRQSLDWLTSELANRQGETNVVITHHGPSIRSLPEGEETMIVRAAYVSNLEYVMHDFEPSLWLHGHVHQSCDYYVGNCRVRCNPRGYPDHRTPAFDEACVLEI